MPLEEVAKGFLEMLDSANQPPIETMSPEEARALCRAVMVMEGDAIERVEDIVISENDSKIPVRLYSATTETNLPTLVYFHGGGWVIGDIDCYDAICRKLAKETGWLVASVEYRLAPEHPFPAAPDDCYFATKWLSENAESTGSDGTRIAVIGDSAGGNLAAVVSQKARDDSGPNICWQGLIYPVTDHVTDTLSYKQCATGYLLERAGMEWFWNLYVPNEEKRSNPNASPLRCESLAGLPPAFVLTAEFDPLRDEGEAYAERLRSQGVDVKQWRLDGMIHGFFGYPAIFPQAGEVCQVIAKELKKFE